MKRAWVLAFLLGLAAPLVAQTTGSIEGVVTDENKAPLPGVAVEAMSPSLQGTRTVAADAGGKFRLVLLPPGRYRVRFALAGFTTIEQADIAVGLGRSMTLQVQMRSAFKEEVRVTGEAPSIDVTSTEIGANITSQQFLGLPNQRNYASIAGLTPGVTLDNGACHNCMNIYGSTGAENAYYIDGVNTSDVEYGTQGKYLNFEFIQEVQIKTGGYQAEFGRATGGLINVITKSGGNEYHGDAFGYLDHSGLQSGIKKSVNAIASQSSRFTLASGYARDDYGIDLGGYALKDTLWFFGAYNYVDNRTDNTVVRDPLQYGGPDYGFPTLGAVLPQTVRRDLWSAKLTWRLTQSQSLVVSAFGDPTTTDGYLPGLAQEAGPPTATNGTNDEGGTDATLKYEAVLGSQWVINGQMARHTEKGSLSGAGINTIGVQDLTHPLFLNAGIPVYDGGLGWAWNTHFERDLYSASASYFLNNFGGDHEFKLGAEYEYIPIDVSTGYTGGQFLYNYGDFWIHRFFATQKPPNGDWSVFDNSFILDPHIVKSKTDNDAAFVQDAWRLFPNLTLDLGLRWESQKLYNRGGTVSLEIKDNWAPRLGIVWDPASNGRTKVYGSWGRFYEAIPSDLVEHSFGGDITVFSFNYDSGNSILCSPDFYPPNGCAAVGGTYTPVDPRTKGQYVEEAIVGGELELANDLVLGGKYIYRSLGRVIEDSLAPDLNFHVGNPGQGNLSTGCDMSYVCTYPTPLPKRFYHGFEVEVRKRATNWQLMASYIYSKLEGNYDGTFEASTGQLDPNMNAAYDYYEFEVHNRGPLTNDRPHQVKAYGTYAFPFGLNVGLAAYWRSGLPITAMGYSRNYAFWVSYLSNRGAWGRTADEYEADLHLGYPLKTSGVEINLMVDVFNLLNRQGETGVDQHYDTTEPNSGALTPVDYSTSTPRPAIKPGTPCSSFFASSADAAQVCNPSFGKANAWQAPRSIRVGLRLSF